MRSNLIAVVVLSIAVAACRVTAVCVTAVCVTAVRVTAVRVIVAPLISQTAATAMLLTIDVSAHAFNAGGSDCAGAATVLRYR